MNPSQTLRRIADLATNPEVKKLAMQLAAELELQHSKQNNEIAIALGNAELGLENQIDSILARLDTMDARDKTILEMLETLQADVRLLQKRPPCMHPGTDDVAE